MTIYKNQLSVTGTLEKFLDDFRDFGQSALDALLQYEGTLNVDFDNYLIIFVDWDEEGNQIFAITKILDEWLPVEVNDRIRKFTAKEVWEYDSNICIKII